MFLGWPLPVARTGRGVVGHQAWLTGITARMSVRAPLRMVAYSVDTAVIKRGPDHYIAGVSIVVTDDSAGS
ncbi:MAG: hypothetical protein M3Y49_16085 [Actinomycetota bacterium]|nr:hypothetical protein [Actinomycetota bacterium]